MEELVTPPEQDTETGVEQDSGMPGSAADQAPPESVNQKTDERAVEGGPDADAVAAQEPDSEAAAEQAEAAEPDAAASPEDADAQDGAPESGAEAAAEQSVSMEELMGVAPESGPAAGTLEEAQLRAVLEAIIYVAEEPVTPAQIAAALQQPVERIRSAMGDLAAEFEKPEHGMAIREVAGGYKMATKPEHHDTVRSFAKSLKPPLKLSLPALETLAVIAYKQPVTAPEIMEIRGVQGTGVLKTLLDRKLIATAGRKNVIGKPILYKTTKEFLIQFGLKDLSELPSLKEFEEIRRMAFADSEAPATEPEAERAPAAPEPEPQGPERES